MTWLSHWKWNYTIIFGRFILPERNQAAISIFISLNFLKLKKIYRIWRLPRYQRQRLSQWEEQEKSWPGKTGAASRLPTEGAAYIYTLISSDCAETHWSTCWASSAECTLSPTEVIRQPHLGTTPHHSAETSLSAAGNEKYHEGRSFSFSAVEVKNSVRHKRGISGRTRRHRVRVRGAQGVPGGLATTCCQSSCSMAQLMAAC